MQKLSAEERITKARAKIMQDKRFVALAGILMIGKWSVQDEPPPGFPAGMPFTAVTNGRDVIYGRDFVQSMNDAQLRFVILHEYYHIMLMHMTMWEHLFKKNRMLANVATDIVINNMLDNQAGANADGFIEFPVGGMLDHQYDGMDTGEVFRRLQQQQQGQGQGAQSGGAGSFDHHEPGGTGIGGALTDEEVKQVKAQIDTALRQAAATAGKVGGDMDRSILELLEPVVRWQDVLRDFMLTTCSGDDESTWRRPSRRWMARDLYMPTRYSEAVKRITIGVDTSGSIGELQLRAALSEIKGVCDTVKPEIVDVIYWDSQVAAHEVYEGDQVAQLTDTTKPVGGGGTSAKAMHNYMRDHDIRPDCIIMFTDGYLNHGDFDLVWPAPIMWCMSTDVVPPSGKVLRIPNA